MGLNIDIPALDQFYYTPVVAKQNDDKIKNVIRPKFGAMIKNTSTLTHVPVPILESFIFIESGGNASAKSPYAAGILQLSPATASDVLVKEQGLGRISEPEAIILKKYLGSRYDLLKTVKPKQTSLGKTFVTNADLLQPEFCLLVGAMLIGVLLNEFTSKDGQINMAKVISVYNGGRQSKSSKKIIPFVGSVTELVAIAPKETADYIKKMIGKNSVLENLV